MADLIDESMTRLIKRFPTAQGLRVDIQKGGKGTIMAKYEWPRPAEESGTISPAPKGRDAEE